MNKHRKHLNKSGKIVCVCVQKTIFSAIYGFLNKKWSIWPTTDGEARSDLWVQPFVSVYNRNDEDWYAYNLFGFIRHLEANVVNSTSHGQSDTVRQANNIVYVDKQSKR